MIKREKQSNETNTLSETHLPLKLLGHALVPMGHTMNTGVALVVLNTRQKPGRDAKLPTVRTSSGPKHDASLGQKAQSPTPSPDALPDKKYWGLHTQAPARVALFG